MTDLKYLKDINFIIEKIIDNRIDEIIENANFEKNINSMLKNINNNISNSNKILKNKKNIKKNEYLMPHNLFIKEAFRIAKDEKHLGYLKDDFIVKIKSFNIIKKSTERLISYNSLWKKLDNDTLNKYINLCKDNDFTNDKYLDVINKSN